MNKLSSNISGVALLLIMLFSISGISIHKISCNMSGNSTTTIITKDSCCDPQPPNSISEDCCDESSAFVQVTDFDRLVKQIQDVQPAVLMTITSAAEIAVNRIRSFQAPKKAPPVRPVDRAMLAVYLI